MKIYLASRFRTLPAVLALKAKLNAAGHQVVSTWHDNEALHPIPFDSPEHADSSKHSAKRDIHELDMAECFIVLTSDCESTPGGLWFEMGVAYNLGIRIIVFGPLINVFCFLSEDAEELMDHVETEEACLETVAREAINVAAEDAAFEEWKRQANL